MAASVVAVIGACTEWIRLSGSGAEQITSILSAQGEGLNGLDKDGVVILPLALVALVIGFLRGIGKGRRAPAVVAAVIGGLILLIGLIDYSDISDFNDKYSDSLASVTAHAGIGLILTPIAGALLLAAGVLAAIRSR